MRKKRKYDFNKNEERRKGLLCQLAENVLIFKIWYCTGNIKIIIITAN